MGLWAERRRLGESFRKGQSRTTWLGGRVRKIEPAMGADAVLASQGRDDDHDRHGGGIGGRAG